jgi:hypothetical protein
MPNDVVVVASVAMVVFSEVRIVEFSIKLALIIVVEFSIKLALIIAGEAKLKY